MCPPLEIIEEVFEVEVLASPTNEVEVTTPGPQGGTGPAGTIAIGDVTSVPDTDPPTVTNVGTPTAAILDFEIPAGEKGDQGDAGTNGTNGTDGDDGAGFYPAGPFTVNNNSSSALSGELFAHATYKAVEFRAIIDRGSGGSHVLARDNFTIFYRNGAWELVMEFGPGVNPSGITWTVHVSTGQITATADNGAGNATIDLLKTYWAA